MNREDVHSNSGAGLQAERVVRTRAVSLGRSPRRRLAGRALLLVCLFGSLGAGALLDLGLHRLGLRWPPILTPLWGIGALLLVGVAWTRFEQNAARERAAQRRDDA
jgi:hypothetical protein